MKGGIRLHPKHGLNPTLPVCIICGKDKGEIALLGAAYKEQAPMHMLLDIEPCAECRTAYLAQGVLPVEASGTERSNAKPSGRCLVLKVEAFQRIFNIPVPAQHIAMVADDAFRAITAQMPEGSDGQ